MDVPPSNLLFISGLQTFLIWWAFLLQPIIQGQIIDAFSQLRSKENTAISDLGQRCFISGISRFDFNNYPGEWECRASGKYAWNFFLYMRHLESIDAQDRNGMEASVMDAYESGSGAFLPVGVFAAKQWETVTDAAADWRKNMTAMFKDLRRDFQEMEKSMSALVGRAGDRDKDSHTDSVLGGSSSAQLSE